MDLVIILLADSRNVQSGLRKLICKRRLLLWHLKTSEEIKHEPDSGRDNICR